MPALGATGLTAQNWGRRGRRSQIPAGLWDHGLMVRSMGSNGEVDRGCINKGIPPRFEVSGTGNQST